MTARSLHWVRRSPALRLPRGHAGRHDRLGHRPDDTAVPGLPRTDRISSVSATATGTYLTASQIDAVAFDGANELPPLPIDWVVDPRPAGAAGRPGAVLDGRRQPQLGDRAGGRGSRGLRPELTFDAAWDLEDDVRLRVRADHRRRRRDLHEPPVHGHRGRHRSGLGNVGPGYRPRVQRLQRHPDVRSRRPAT